MGKRFAAVSRATDMAVGTGPVNVGVINGYNRSPGVATVTIIASVRAGDVIQRLD